MRVSEVQSSVVVEDGSEAQAMCGVQESVLGPSGRPHCDRPFTSGRIRHVYVIGMVFRGYDYESDDVVCKIGIADDAAARFVQIREAYDVEPKPPFEPGWITYGECRAEDARKIEAHLHSKFAMYRLNGEWFKMKIEQVDSIYKDDRWDVPWQCFTSRCWCEECLRCVEDEPIMGIS